MIPSYFHDAVATNKRALDNFYNLAESYRGNFFVDRQRKDEKIRKKRVAEAMKLLEQNQKRE